MDSTDERLMPGEAMREYSTKLATLAFDVLIDAGTIERARLDKAVMIAATELYIRFVMGDLPPRSR